MERARRRRLHWVRRAVAGLVLVALVGFAGLVGGAAWFDSALHRSPVLTARPDRPDPGPGTTWLFVGSDSRQDLSADQQKQLSTGGDVGAGRTDTLLLIHTPTPGSGRPTTVVSIPRDSYVPIPGYGRDKINAAFTLGGAPLLVQTVEGATGLRIDHYLEIGFGGFAALVDALGGVDVCIDEPVDDPLAGINLPAGCRLLDGRAALGFVRSRATARADLDRMANQRLFLAALLQRLTATAVWLDPRRWYAVSHAAADALTVDTKDHVWDLAGLAFALHGSVTGLTVPIGALIDSDVGNVVVWDHQAAGRLFDSLARDEPAPQFGP